MQSLPLYTLCFFFMLLNGDIVEIEKPDGICSPTLILDQFLGLFLHPSIFSAKNSTSVWIINGALLVFLYCLISRTLF